MTRCAFIGLGIMGREMARNLLAAGYEVTVWNRSPGPAQDLESAGAVVASSPAEAARSADVVLTCLLDGPVVEQVLLGDGGVLEGARPGAIVVDSSTIDPATSVRVATAGGERGVTVLDAPVSGGDAGARQGTLAIMIGGERAAVEQVRPILEVLGSTIEHVGAAGAGQRVKAANQLLVAGIYSLVGEALLLVEEDGIDADAAVAVLAGGLAGSRILDTKAARMRQRSFEPGARVDLHRKDLGIVLELARDAGVAVPVTAVVAQLYEALAAQGGGDLDHSAVLLVLERLAGRDA